MNCKDCVHYGVCMDFTTLKESEYCQNYDKQEELCDHFKNKANFVEIPCRCKDCDHFINYNPDRTYCEEHSDGWGDNIVYVDENDYCSFGIRKKGGADNG